MPTIINAFMNATKAKGLSCTNRLNNHTKTATSKPKANNSSNISILPNMNFLSFFIEQLRFPVKRLRILLAKQSVLKNLITIGPRISSATQENPSHNYYCARCLTYSRVLSCVIAGLIRNPLRLAYFRGSRVKPGMTIFLCKFESCAFLLIKHPLARQANR